MAGVELFNDIVTYVSGVGNDGRVSNFSYGTWNGSLPGFLPSNYGSTSDLLKWGSPAAGSGASVRYAFDAASGWTAQETGAFVSAMAAWSAIANIRFEQAMPADAGILFVRDRDGAAETWTSGTPGQVGSSVIGAAQSARVEIDTNANGFGPLGGSFDLKGGYPWYTLMHEIGHAIGLGHGGAYDGEDAQWSGATYDTQGYTLMSYFPLRLNGAPAFGIAADGSEYVPMAPMMVDILAVQRLYGAPLVSPLAGGQTFGFNSTIQGDARVFYDFTVNRHPVVTIWTAGSASTLDLSGFAEGSRLSLREGSFNDVAGLKTNLAIAYGGVIDKLLLGPGNDYASGNDVPDVMLGGLGADTLVGGTSNDHLYGFGSIADPRDGNDRLIAGDGSDYLQGNAGSDTLEGGEGSDRIYGGAGADSILGEAGNDTINGNLGDDRIDAGPGNDFVRGGQGNDYIFAQGGHDTLMGDLGDDTLDGSVGVDLLIGGPGADRFVGADGSGLFWQAGRDYLLDRIEDFEQGIDRIQTGIGVPTVVRDFGTVTSIAAAQQLGVGTTLFDQDPATIEVAVGRLGGDTILMWRQMGVGQQPGIGLQGFVLTGNIALGAADFI